MVRVPPPTRGRLGVLDRSPGRGAPRPQGRLRPPVLPPPGILAAPPWPSRASWRQRRRCPQRCCSGRARPRLRPCPTRSSSTRATACSRSACPGRIAILLDSASAFVNSAPERAVRLTVRELHVRSEGHGVRPHRKVMVFDLIERTPARVDHSCVQVFGIGGSEEQPDV